MLLKYFYDTKLAHASYMVGCQRDKVAVIVDPGRDIEGYLEMAKREGLKIIAVAETHIHADYVSGARELADRIGAKLYLSDAGPDDWKYQFASEYDSKLVKDGDVFRIGNIKFEVMHTPGHTPESISFVLTDEGGGADRPMGIFTGDFVFVGSIGRPDLLEEAAGVQGSAREGAHELFHSVERFKSLPEYLQVWPAHGAGSACGKGLGAIPSSTIGYEKLFNPALQYDDETKFVEYILADQPEAPKYFKVMKRVNKEGPKVLGEGSSLKWMGAGELDSLPDDAAVVDISSKDVFEKNHFKGSINIPLSMIASWAGWLLDYSKPIYLIGDQAGVEEGIRVMQKIGVDCINGAFDREALAKANRLDTSYVSKAPKEMEPFSDDDNYYWIDVRSNEEWKAGHIPHAHHHFLGRLPDQLDSIPSDKKLVVQCASGMRSAIGSSLLQSKGFEVINLDGGYQQWTADKLPTVKPTEKTSAAN